MCSFLVFLGSILKMNLLVKEPHSAANVAIIIQIRKSFIQESVSDKDSYNICLQIIHL